MGCMHDDWGWEIQGVLAQYWTAVLWTTFVNLFQASNNTGSYILLTSGQYELSCELFPKNACSACCNGVRRSLRLSWDLTCPELRSNVIFPCKLLVLYLDSGRFFNIDRLTHSDSLVQAVWLILVRFVRTTLIARIPWGWSALILWDRVV